MAFELIRAEETDGQLNPITAVCIVSDKNKAPKGFSPILRTTDDNADADIWRESSFSIFARPTRYIAYSRDVPEQCLNGPAISVITDLTVVKETEPVPHGYVPIDYTADSREKALRKKFLCLKSEPRDAVVDAVGEICILGKTKKTPKGYSCAGEIDGALIVFKVVVIPQTFGMKHSASAQSLPPARSAPAPPGLMPLYPSLQPSNSASDIEKNPSFVKPKGVDGVPFKLHPSVTTGATKQDDNLPQIGFDIQLLNTDAFHYSFALEQDTLDQIK
ncbi:unnamed protein product [Auanema sp. JU1783]|nr:unnamed protein product [Auanema sp. JU1783]